MEQSSGNSGDFVGRVLLRDLNGMLMQEGLMLADRTIIIPDDLVNELDVHDIVIGRNDEFSRTVCHVHRPSDEAFFWRHDTYVAWDDGRTAHFSVDLGLDEDDKMIKDGLDRAEEAVKDELRRLVAIDAIDIPTAGELHRSMLSGIAVELAQANEALLHSEELEEQRGAAAIVDEIVAQGNRIRDAKTMDAPPELRELHRLIDVLHAAHRDAVLLRVRLNEFYLALSERMLAEAEAGDGTPIASKESWELLQLLDKVSDL